MKNHWNATRSIEREPVLDEYQAALAAVGKPQAMRKGDRICQHVQTVLDLRHALLPQEPEWQGSARHHFQSRLNQLPANRQLTSGPWFPNQVLSADCADWACDVSVAFVDVWSGDMELKNPPDTRLEKGWPAP